MPATLPTLGDELQRAPLRSQIADRLRELVRSGLLQRGDELPGERDLAHLLNVSRESVRGAIQLLAAQGVLDVSHGSRTRVAAGAHAAVPHRFDVDDSCVIEARRVLEPALAAEAATGLDGLGLRRLHALLDAQRSMLTDPVRFQISDQAFHHSIYAAAGNPVLMAYAEETYTHAYAHRRAVMQQQGGIAAAIADHARILDALDRQDAAGAAQAMTGHIDCIARLVRAASRSTNRDPR